MVFSYSGSLKNDGKEQPSAENTSDFLNGKQSSLKQETMYSCSSLDSPQKIADSTKVLGKKIEKLIKGMKKMEDNGIDEEILICYLIVHTHMARKDIKSMLENSEEFIDKLLKKDIMKAISQE